MITGQFDFDFGLARMAEAAKVGENAFFASALSEQIASRQEKVLGVEDSNSDDLETDLVSQKILKNLGGKMIKRPIRVKGHGNCLFNSISVALSGTEENATRLRYFASIQLGLNRDEYKEEFMRRNFQCVTEDYSEACLNISKKGGFSCAWTLMCLSDVTERKIVCLYPRMNGLFDPVAKILDSTYTPRHGKMEK